MPLRALQGFIYFVFSLTNVPIVCPHYSCISRRAKQIEVSFKRKRLIKQWGLIQPHRFPAPTAFGRSDHLVASASAAL